MAAAQQIAVGSDAAASGDIVVTDPVTVGLNTADADAPIPSDALVYIQAKDAGGAYWNCGKLTSQEPALVISGPGTYRLYRPTQAQDVGAFNA